jgi:flagellar biosynthesis protein FlhG
MARTVTITSGKGGVGKTHISVNLALELACLGHRTCLFDADLGLANVNLLLGLYPTCTLEQVIDGQKTLDEILIHTDYGVDIVPGGSGVQRLAELGDTDVSGLLTSLGAMDRYDFVLFDTSSGISRSVLAFCMACDELVVVVTPEPTSLTDAYALLKVLDRNGFSGTAKILVNQWHQTREAKDIYHRLKRSVDRFLPIEVLPAGMMIHDPHVEAAVLKQQPFAALFPDCEAAKCIRVTARHLAAGQTAAAQPMETFWEKCLQWIAAPLETAGETFPVVPVPINPAKEAGPADIGSLPGIEGQGLFQVPVLSQVLDQLFTCLDQTGHDPTVMDLVGLDPILFARMLSVSVANRADRPMPDISQRLSTRLSIDSLKHIAQGAAISQVLLVNGQGIHPLTFWRHSLRCAILARRMAEMLGYGQPMEAYVAGLLHDIGKTAQGPGTGQGGLIPHENPDAHWLVGADWIRAWGLAPLLDDAIRYHHEPLDRIVDAFPLVKIVYLANRLTRFSENRPALLQEADVLFGLDASRVQRLVSGAESEMTQTENRLEIAGNRPNHAPLASGREPAAFSPRLIGAVRETVLLAGSLERFLTAEAVEDAVEGIREGLRMLFDIHRVIFLMLQADGPLLVDQFPGVKSPTGALTGLPVCLKDPRGLLDQSMAACTVMDSLTDSHSMPLTIMDEQIIRMLGTDGVLCVPLVFRRRPLGVMAAGWDRHRQQWFRPKKDMLARFAAHAAACLARFL